MPDLGLVVVLVLILGAEFVNGWTDSPNAIATVVSTRSLSPLQAVVMASILNLLGVLSGTAVAETIGKEIIDPSAVDLLTVAGAMVGIILWSTLAARWGIPTSESHALVAGLTGAGFASAGPQVLVWEGWKKVLQGLLLSTALGFFAGLFVVTLVYWCFRRTQPTKVSGLLRVMQIFSSALMAFSHGSNDGQKFMGTMTLTLVLGNALDSFSIPVWVILLCAAVMALGTLTGGWRIMKTMGMKISRLQTYQGFAAETAAASTIELASRLGIPLSTTHTISTAIMGVCAARNRSKVRWRVGTQLMTAWILTFPICAFISWSVVKLFRILF
ncbi:MAG: inorganic phosphate transporter [Acidobacteria bacterium]|nr:inorganic phosphate transporter [Acidobacteriota bacterium]